jgi:hypothetical protein
MFTSSADVVFEIVFIATKLTLGVDKQTHFWPKTTIMTVHIPEHGALKCEHEGKIKICQTSGTFLFMFIFTGTYIFRFGNLAQSSSWLPSTAVKVHFALNAKKYK